MLLYKKIFSFYTFKAAVLVRYLHKAIPRRSALLTIIKPIFIDEWTVNNKIELLEDDIFHKLIEFDDLDRPKAEMLLKEQAEKFKCKIEFDKKLEAVKKMVKLSNIQSIKPAELPFIKVKDIDIMTGKIEYYVSRPVLAEYFRQHNRYFWIGTAGGENPLRYNTVMVYTAAYQMMRSEGF